MAPSPAYFDRLAEVRQIIDTAQDLRSASQSLRQYSDDFDLYREMMHLFTSPDWIDPLIDSRILDPEGSISDKHRLASVEYLRRMTPLAYSKTIPILFKINPDTPPIAAALFDAARQAPAPWGAILVHTICKIITSHPRWIMPKAISELCRSQFSNGRFDEVNDLFEAVLVSGRKANSSLDEYWCKEAIEAVFPFALKVNSERALHGVCGLLNSVIDTHHGPVGGRHDDLSAMWRPAVEEHAQNDSSSYAGAIVGLLRMEIEQAISSGRLTLELALSLVRKHRLLIFERLQIHLINVFADDRPTLARETMLNRDYLFDYDYKHEYARLIEKRFDLLDADGQEEWFGWIDQGPERPSGNAAMNTDQVAARDNWWRFERLHWVRAHLSGQRREFYEHMLKQHGAPKMADLNYRVTSSAEQFSSSPIKLDELRPLAFEEAIKKVEGWQPGKHDFDSPNRMGLTATFGEYVATNPQGFSKQAGILKGKSRHFVRTFIDRMAQAAKTKADLDLDALLDLFAWVVERPIGERGAPEFARGEWLDDDWQWTRDQISTFVRDWCTANADNAPRAISRKTREALWAVLSRLTRDTSKSDVIRNVDDEDVRVHDYLDMGINSSRGKAVDAMLKYARLMGKCQPNSKEGVPNGWDAMPEVRAELEWQLDSNNATVEAMAIIGSEMGLLYWIDRDWLASQRTKLFDLRRYETEPKRAIGWAAWNSFMVWGSAHIEFLRMFAEEYSYAVDQASKVELKVRNPYQPMAYLGEHLVVLYGRGQLTNEYTKHLMERFLTRAHPDLRRHAISFVGRIASDDHPLPKEVVDRFQNLWELYWKTVGQEDAKEAGERMFGAWFASGKFDEQWSLDQMEKFVAVWPTPEPDDQILDRLIKLATSGRELQSMRILRSLINGDTEGWRVSSWLKSAEKLLAAGVAAGGEARAVAVEIINVLGRRGHMSVEKLLPPRA